MELAALIAALQAFAAHLETRLAALEARPTDPEIAARLAALEMTVAAIATNIAALLAFNDRLKALE